MQNNILRKVTDKDKDFFVLGFTANNFLRQEPGTNQEIKKFCTLTYNVTFPIFSKISVRGKDIAPLYRFLTEKQSNPDFYGSIKWNFTKFLIDRNGKIIDRFKPKDKPDSKKILTRIQELINQ